MMKRWRSLLLAGTFLPCLASAQQTTHGAFDQGYQGGSPGQTGAATGSTVKLGTPGGAAALDANGLLLPAQLPATSSTGAIVPAVASVMDPYSANLYALYSTLPLLSAYTGPLYTARRESDGATVTVSGTGGTYNSAALSAWAAGSDVFVVTVYDQSGNGLAITQNTANAQPKLNLSGAYPVLEFDGQYTFLPGTGTLTPWLQGATGASVVALRKVDNVGVVATSKSLMFASTGTSTASSRLTMGIDNTAATDAVQGRRADGDALNRSGGFAPDTAWDTEIGRWDYANALVYHHTSLQSETRAFQTAGAVANTPSLAASIGSGTGANFWQGKLAAIALYTAALTDQQTSAVQTALTPLAASVQGPAFGLDWGGAALTGTYTLAAGLNNYTVDQPNGSAPALGTYATYYYRHHTRVALLGTRVFVAYSAAPQAEEQAGEVTMVASTSAAGTAFGTPVNAIPAQVTSPQLTGVGDIPGSVITYPRTFVTYSGNLYLIVAADQVNIHGASPAYQQGVALFAVQCNSDGTLGTPFLISPQVYTPQSGVTAYAYSATLSAPLFALAQSIGVWGGSAPLQPASLWQGFNNQGNGLFVEPNTVTLANGTLLRIWRKSISGGNLLNWLYVSKSLDNGRTWSPITRTSVPSAATENAAVVLSSGLIVVVGNPQNVTTNRDPLYVASFGGTSFALCGSPLAVRQGLSNSPTYPNGANGGAQYPSVTTDGTLLYIAYSMEKQSVGLTTIPVSSLTTCN